MAQDLLKGEDFQGSVFFLCLLCGACESTCPNQVPLLSSFFEVRKAKVSVWKRSLARLFEPYRLERLSALARKSGLATLLGTAAGPALPRPFRERASLPPEGELLLFLGCGADLLYPQATLYLRDLLDSRGLSLGLPPGQGCCGLAALALGDEEAFRGLALANLEALARRRGPVLTLCASCYFALKEVYPRFFAGTPYEGEARHLASRLREATAFLLQEGFSWSEEGKVALHLPCHLRFLREEAWWEALPFPIIAECCGQGGTFGLFHPQVARDIFRRGLLQTLMELSPDLLLTNCTACYYRLNVHLRGFPKIKLPVEMMR